MKAHSKDYEALVKAYSLIPGASYKAKAEFFSDKSILFKSLQANEVYRYCSVDWNPYDSTTIFYFEDANQNKNHVEVSRNTAMGTHKLLELVGKAPEYQEGEEIPGKW